MFFTLTDRASTIPSNIRGCQSGMWSAGQENIRGTSTKSYNESMKNKKKKQQTIKKKAAITKSTCQKKMEEGHSIERVWYSASREPFDTLPGSQPCTKTHSIYNSILSRFQVSLTAQSTSLRESLDWSNQRGWKASRACYSHPRCNLNLARLFRFSLPLPVFGRIFRFSPTRP